jgi:hypothetical protein
MALKLLTQSFGPIPLAAAPPGATPSNTAFTITSSGGPFCIVGLYIVAGKLNVQPAGLVQIYLSRINGSGVSHPALELAEGMGVKPQDLVVSYGSVMSSSYSLSFQVTQWPSASGTGAPFDIDGTIVFLAEASDTLTVAVSAP